MPETGDYYSINELAGDNEFIVYIEHDVSDVNVKAVRKEQLDKVLKKYNVKYMEELYDNKDIDWEEVKNILDKGSRRIEYVNVLTY